MKYWHRRIHLLAWALITPVVFGLFLTALLLLDEKQEHQEKAEPARIFAPWERELNNQ